MRTSATLSTPASGAPAFLTDDARMRALVGAHVDFIWRTLRRLGVPESGTDDAVQHVFLVAARKLREVSAAEERAFLAAIAVRVASESRRAHARHPHAEEGATDELADGAPNPEEAAEQRRAKAIVDDILSGLPDEVRAIFVLFELEELTMAEIAEALSLPPGTVASRLRRRRELFEEAARRWKAREQRLGGGR